MKEQQSKEHKGRKHSKFSASGASRWFNCPGSVALSEGLPDKDTPWSIEGTKAHEVLEDILRKAIASRQGKVVASSETTLRAPLEMQTYAINAANFILKLYRDCAHSDILVESRIGLTFIHPEMFGTFDGAVLDHFGTLHVFDYKYGAGYPVSPKENYQMIFYGIGLAAKYDWNFKRVRLWIIQPRVKGYEGPLFWELSILELKARVTEFRQAVDRVLKFPTKYREGSWCHFCKAKLKCPLKLQARSEKAQLAFLNTPIHE